MSHCFAYLKRPDYITKVQDILSFGISML